MPDTSIIISFYNNVDAIKCILLSLENQKSDFEVIIADDGSNSNAISLLSKIKDKVSYPIKIVTQLDIGFRKNRILNKAIYHSTSDYLIFIDGDCIPQKSFISDHLKHKGRGIVLNGRRADIPSELKIDLLADQHPEIYFTKNIFRILSLYLRGKGKNIEKGIRIDHDFLFRRLNRKKKGLLGCNFSIYKDDLLAINGFDNRYEVAGTGEDTDIEYRLTENGIKIRNLFYRATMLHPLHPELPRCPSADVIFQETKKMKQIIAKDGYHQAFDKD